MSVTIEGVMWMIESYAEAVATGADRVCNATYKELCAALSALVAQARDEEAEACAEVCERHSGESDDEWSISRNFTVARCAQAIRARIAGRKDGGGADVSEETDDCDPLECPHCHDDGYDPWNDYLLPCPVCQREELT